MKIILLLFMFMILECLSVSVDYYLGNNEPDPEEKQGNTILPEDIKNLTTLRIMRRINKKKSTLKYVTRDNESDYENYDDLSEIEEQMIRKASKDKTPIDENMSDADSRETQIGFDTNTILRQGRVLGVSKVMSIEEILKEYTYHDDEPLTSEFPLLRDKDKTTESQTEHFFNKITILKNPTEEEHNSEKVSIDFYNLVPASSVNDDDDNFANFNFVNNNVWYVPENSPCWELPILYGELGRSMLAKDVFLMYPGSLKDVIETKEEQSQPTRPLNIPVSQTMNKWCAAGPCYGDHTLCLFSDNTNSKLCREGYKVNTPTMVERIGLVNTVNSMRNRIANGETENYKHLPKAANMNQLIYDFDLEDMAVAWLQQCLPGPAACSALDRNYVTQLECTRYAKHCCIDSFRTEKASKCIPQYECYVEAILGCVHVWFYHAGKKLTTTDVECGHITPATFYSAQLIWAETNKIGCAYGKNPDGDVRVVCNFAPGAPFYIDTKYFCGFIGHKGVMEKINSNITDPQFLATLGISLVPVDGFDTIETELASHHVNYSIRSSDIDVLSKIYKRKWIREKLNQTTNGTIGLVARLVTRYTFGEDGGSQCDMNEAIYVIGEPGAKCVERGRRFHALCYDFRDPTPGYRLVAVIAPVALFSLILYDLFSGVVRQTNF